MSSPFPPLNTLDQVRILYGPHAGKKATVVATAPSGHVGHDLVALHLNSSETENFADLAAPIWLFRFALDKLPSNLPTGRGYVAEPAVPESCRPAQRTQRFNKGQDVIVCQPALTAHGLRGTVEEVFLDPTDAGHIGSPGTALSARYIVHFDWNGFDEPHPSYRGTYYDHELRAASEA